MGRDDETRLYGDLSEWWPWLSAPADYEEEAALYANALGAHESSRRLTLLELGSGGGNNASHLKSAFEPTLVDRSRGMIAVSQSLNPTCQHVVGDMRDVRLGRVFDRVLIHDAIAYMTTSADLRAAIETAFLHLRPGGSALFAPDFVRETFSEGTSTGGHDRAGRALRYLEWRFDPEPADSTYTVDYAFLLHERDRSVAAIHDRHVLGLFSREEWLATLRDVGFEAEEIPFEHSECAPGEGILFRARREG